MPDIGTLRAQYFVAAGDTNPPTEPLPQEFAGSKITPLIDAFSYNQALEAALATVGTGPDAAANAGHFILIQNWCLALSGGEYKGVSGFAGSNGTSVDEENPYYLDGPPDPGPPPTGGNPLID